ncbi:MAG: 16S rRNA (cytosine(1402)-N(4))-methyltransferase RsmH [Deltaproteobacteria bacterium]|nr:16S rRNA (cytosine(1402)-N(4))-methyltransferase RsmH [Deltaproteobacteria bacterium]
MEFIHRTVMAREAVEFLRCRPGATFVDGTLGGGGHALEILKASSPDGRLIGLDRDEDAIEAAGKTLSAYKGRTTLVRENFKNIREVLNTLGITSVDGIILDLGVSSYQFEEAERGFSFRASAMLDMRMDRRQKKTAHELVNSLDEAELTRIFFLYGEERFSSRIARAIVRKRQSRPVETTGELKEIILSAVPKKFHGGAVHPATRVFQALRIAVNDELEDLKEGLRKGFESLSKGGRLSVISFHSLEDRIVQETFRGFSTGCVCPPRLPVCVCGLSPAAKLVTKKAVTPEEREIEENPRSRSAKLRVIEKI